MAFWCLHVYFYVGQAMLIHRVSFMWNASTAVNVYAIDNIILTYDAVYVCLLCDKRDYKMYNDLLTFQDSS